MQQAWALLYHCDGYSYDEIGSMMHLTKAAAYLSIRSAQRRLREREPYVIESENGWSYELLRNRLRREAKALLECLENHLPMAHPPGVAIYDAAGRRVGQPAKVITADDVVEEKCRLLFGIDKSYRL